MTEHRTETDSIGRDRGRRRPLLGRADRALARTISRSATPTPTGCRSRSSARSAILKKAAALVNAELGVARPGDRRPDRRGGRRGDRRQARRPLPAVRLADRLRHADQHERQRGDREPRDRDGRRRARLEDAGPPERPRQHVAVVQRHVPDRDAHRRGARRSCDGCCPPVRALRDALDAKRSRVRRHRQDRPHAPAGRRAAHARAGVLRLRRAARRRPRADRGDAARACTSSRSAAPRSAPA